MPLRSFKARVSEGLAIRLARVVLCALVVCAVLVLSAAGNAQQPDQPAAQGQFLRAIAPLDEPRGLCVDIPGHRDRVNVHAPLSVHTCKWSIWNLDEQFDGDALAVGKLRMTHYGLCLGVRAAEKDAQILLGDCNGEPLRRWEFSDKRLRLAADRRMCLTIGPEPSALTPGGRRLPSRHVARSLALAPCDDSADDRQLWQVVAPER